MFGGYGADAEKIRLRFVNAVQRGGWRKIIFFGKIIWKQLLKESVLPLN